jgi:multisubunit Na+/H+ antiporter MnhC subunit
MRELFLFGVVIGGVICLLLTVMMLRLGDMIDRFPTVDEENREKSIWSPREFTRVSAIIFWPLFGIGSFMVLRPDKIVIVGGIALLAGIVLFLLTAVIFSFSVYNVMQSKKKEKASPSPILGLMQGFPRKKNPIVNPKPARYGTSSDRK